MILGLDHVGLLTTDLVKAGAQLDALGLRKVEEGEAAAYGVACEFWQYSDDPSDFAIELVAPLRDEGTAVTGRLAKSGPGLYHVALEVDDLEGELERLRDKRFAQLDAEPCAGARPGMRVAFMYLGKPTKILIELVQYEEPRRVNLSLPG